jgi:histidinol-phosphate aminotransferase
MKFINKYLRNLAPYKVASHQVWEVSDNERKSILKLDWNEATIPPSPNVQKRLRKLVEYEDVYFLYPSTNNLEILNNLSQYSDLPVANIQYFGSSDSLHEYLVRMYVTVGDPILVLGPTYDNFRLTCETQGAVIHYFDYDEQFNLNESEFIKSIEIMQPSLVYICNPNNPSGTLIPKVYIIQLLTRFPEIMFLVDEAYYEFSGETMADQVRNYDNLFVTRTFSKAFALANFRAGYLLSDEENIQQISKIRNPKNFSTFAQEAVIGVLTDIPYMKAYVKEVILSKDWFSNELQELSFIRHVYKSSANFVLVDFTSFEMKLSVFNVLNENQIFVRNLMHSERLKNTLRFSIGTKKQMERVLGVLQSISK